MRQCTLIGYCNSMVEYGCGACMLALGIVNTFNVRLAIL